MGAHGLGCHLALHGPVENARGMGAGFAHVDMGIGLVGHENLRPLDHFLGHHRMKIQRHRDRDRIAQFFTQ